MKNYDVLNELVLKTQELHRAIFDKGYGQGQKDILEQLRYDDCISRQAVLNTLDKMDKALDTDRTVKSYKELLTECYKDLPLIMPKKKTGWHIIDGRVSKKFCCSCGYIEIMDNSMNNWNYCPICGAAKMEEANK